MDPRGVKNVKHIRAKARGMRKIIKITNKSGLNPLIKKLFTYRARLHYLTNAAFVCVLSYRTKLLNKQKKLNFIIYISRCTLMVIETCSFVLI